MYKRDEELAPYCFLLHKFINSAGFVPCFAFCGGWGHRLVSPDKEVGLLSLTGVAEDPFMEQIFHLRATVSVVGPQNHGSWKRPLEIV